MKQINSIMCLLALIGCIGCHTAPRVNWDCVADPTDTQREVCSYTNADVSCQVTVVGNHVSIIAATSNVNGASTLTTVAEIDEGKLTSRVNTPRNEQGEKVDIPEYFDAFTRDCYEPAASLPPRIRKAFGGVYEIR